MNRPYQLPDLDSVLKTLASFTTPQNQQHQGIPLQASPPNAGHNQGQQQRPPAEQAAPVPEKKLIDPATITDWSSGLRCVMKTVAAHENIIREIRRMIKVQHDHEDQWWKGRQALLQKQEARKEGQKKLDEVLRAVGGIVVQNLEDPAEELRTFDMKVYRAQVQMVKEMSAKLKGFGVPFFGTRSELVRKKGGMPAEEDGKKIDETELVELQRRMIALLEDLCNEV